MLHLLTAPERHEKVPCGSNTGRLRCVSAICTVRRLGAVAAVAMTLVLKHNMPLGQGHFARVDRNQMEWSGFGSFSLYDLRCHLIANGMTTSRVRCRFKTHNPPIDVVRDHTLVRLHATQAIWSMVDYRVRTALMTSSGWERQ